MKMSENKNRIRDVSNKKISDVLRGMDPNKKKKKKGPNGEDLPE